MAGSVVPTCGPNLLQQMLVGGLHQKPMIKTRQHTEHESQLKGPSIQACPQCHCIVMSPQREEQSCPTKEWRGAGSEKYLNVTELKPKQIEKLLNWTELTWA